MTAPSDASTFAIPSLATDLDLSSMLQIKMGSDYNIGSLILPDTLHIELNLDAD